MFNRNDFIEKLTKAGWQLTPWEELFKAGHELEPEAEVIYRNTFSSLRVSYYVKKRYILFEVFQKNNDEILDVTVRFYVNRNFSLVLDKIITTQNIINRHNYVNFIGEMIELCELVLLETPKGLVKVTFVS